MAEEEAVSETVTVTETVTETFERPLTADANDPHIGWTAQQGSVPPTDPSLAAEKYVAGQLPDPAVLAETNSPPVMPATAVVDSALEHPAVLPAVGENEGVLSDVQAAAAAPTTEAPAEVELAPEVEAEPAPETPEEPTPAEAPPTE